jgi:CheY-like chemotaxis protein
MAQYPRLEAEVVELLEAVTAELLIRTIDLGPMIESVVAGFPDRERMRIEFRCSQRITVLGDRARLRFALVTLVRMVLACSPPYSRIAVKAADHGSHVTISVSAAAQPHKPYAVAIDVVRRVAEAHGGRVTALTFAELVTWCVELPASSRASRRWPACSRVLLVDDNKEQLTALADVLRMEGLAAECATSGREAIARLDIQVPDFLIVDFQLADYNGADVIAHARTRRPQVPAALLTGYPQDHPKIVQAIAATHSEYLGKPVDIDALFEVVTNALR